MSQTLEEMVRLRLEPLLRRQGRHPVHPWVEVLWDAGVSLDAVTMRVGQVVEVVRPEVVVQRVGERARMIERETRDPLRFACEAEMWRRIDLEMCRKRLEHPGQVLELLVTGGIRPGKTEGATRRVVASYFWTPKSWCVGLHETDITSRSIQQARVYRFLPPEMDPGSGKLKKDKRTKFSYSEATGFTGSEFNLYWECYDERGRAFEGGGRFEFRFYKQDPSTLQGMELTCATSDELVPLHIVKTIRERLTTRAGDTAEPEFLARIEEAKRRLEAGEDLPPALLAVVYHGVHLITFTPKEGWNATVNSFLQGARKYGWVEAELLKGRAGVQDCRVPRFAQPVESTRLVAYLHTADNVMRPAWPAVKKLLEGKSEEEIRITAYGDVKRSWMNTFGAYDETRHVRTWKEFPEEATIYEVCDPAGSKPWVLMWLMVDAAERVWIAQEWPCPGWEIPEVGFPGEWAVPSEHEKRNGDAGPAQKLRLFWNRARYTRQVWEGRRRLLLKLKEAGVEWRGRFVEERLTWEKQPGWTLEGRFAGVQESWMDSRFAATKTETQDKEVVTLLEAMWDEENAIDFLPAPGDRLCEGDQFIQEALADEVMGLPRLMVNEECENTRFMFRTYALPEYREHTTATDEACKDFRDPVAYCLLKDPRHVPMQRRNRGPAFGY